MHIDAFVLWLSPVRFASFRARVGALPLGMAGDNPTSKGLILIFFFFSLNLIHGIAINMIKVPLMP